MTLDFTHRIVFMLFRSSWVPFFSSDLVQNNCFLGFLDKNLSVIRNKLISLDQTAALDSGLWRFLTRRCNWVITRQSVVHQGHAGCWQFHLVAPDTYDNPSFWSCSPSVTPEKGTAYSVFDASPGKLSGCTKWNITRWWMSSAFESLFVRAFAVWPLHAHRSLTEWRGCSFARRTSTQSVGLICFHFSKSFYTREQDLAYIARSAHYVWSQIHYIKC